MNYAELLDRQMLIAEQNRKKQQLLVNQQHVANYLKTAKADDALAVTEFLAGDPNYAKFVQASNETIILGATWAALAFINAKEKSDKLDVYKNWLRYIRSTSYRPNPESFNTVIGSHKLLRYESANLVSEHLMKTLQPILAWPVWNKSTKLYDLNKIKPLQLKFLIKRGQTQINAGTAGMTAAKIAALVGSCVLAGASYILTAGLSFAGLDDILIGSWSWLMSVIGGNWQRKANNKADEMAQLTAAKCGFTPANLKVLAKRFLFLGDTLLKLWPDTDELDYYLDELERRYGTIIITKSPDGDIDEVSQLELTLDQIKELAMRGETNAVKAYNGLAMWYACDGAFDQLTGVGMTVAAVMDMTNT